MLEKFIKKKRTPSVDVAVLHLNKNLSYLVDDVQVFKDPVDKRLEMLFKDFLSLAASAMQPVVADIGVC